MEEFEIKEGRPFGPETLIPLPKMSYEQELLNTPVPFENRVEFISDYVKLDAVTMSIDTLSKKIKKTIRETQALANEVGALLVENEDNDVIYEKYTYEVIEEELRWIRAFDELEDYITDRKISSYLNKSKQWVREHAAGLGVYPEHRPEVSNRRIFTYPKSTAYMLREIMLHFPPANNLYSIEETVEIVGKSRPWVESMIDEHNLPTASRTSALGQRPGIHLTEETIEKLKLIAAQLPAPAGNRYTASAIKAILNKSDRWVNKRLEGFKNKGALYLDDFNREEIHYEEEVIEALRAKKNEYAPAGNWMTAPEIAAELGKTIDWLRPRLKKFIEVSEIRLMKSNNRPERHYPPEVTEFLKSEMLKK